MVTIVCTYEWLNNYLAQRLKLDIHWKIFALHTGGSFETGVPFENFFQKTLILDLKANSVASQIAILGWYFRALIEYNDYFYDPWKPFRNTFSNCISKQAHTKENLTEEAWSWKSITLRIHTSNIKVHQPSS